MKHLSFIEREELEEIFKDEYFKNGLSGSINNFICFLMKYNLINENGTRFLLNERKK